MNPIRRALISVFDKKGIVDFAKSLSGYGVEILSTGGTARLLKEAGIEVIEISDYVSSPEILGGRVKSLHPKIHGGILAIRNDEQHLKDLENNDIGPIDMVVVNFYPFEEVIKDENLSLADAIENIDIGGPTMVRAAAKNYSFVTVLTDPEDYEPITKELEANGGAISAETNFGLSLKAFANVTGYDAAISNYLGAIDADGGKSKFPETYTLHLKKQMSLRYGENPHQDGAFYVEPKHEGATISTSKQLGGKELSLNNIYDSDTALEAVKEFTEVACVIVKHNNPCGVATGQTLREAFANAKECDPVSAFGGVIAFNNALDAETAEEIGSMFIEVLIAPGFSEKALEILSAKKNLRLLQTRSLGERAKTGLDIKRVQGGALIQDRDLTADEDFEDFKVPTKKRPTESELNALKFAWKVCKHVKSNAIVLAREGQTVGIGAGQMSRVDSVKLSKLKANLETEGTVLASDAFFPFRDGIDEAAKSGVTAIVQPGGSIRDEDIIAACDEHGIAMVFTGTRHFRH